jgi:hypothetical protein
MLHRASDLDSFFVTTKAMENIHIAWRQNYIIIPESKELDKTVPDSAEFHRFYHLTALNVVTRHRHDTPLLTG